MQRTEMHSKKLEIEQDKNKKCHGGETCNQSIDCMTKSVDMALRTILPDC